MTINTNLILSATNSFYSHSEGKDVAVFVSESDDFDKDVESLGFKLHQYFSQQDGQVRTSKNYWNDETKVMICPEGDNKFTIANEHDCVTGSSFEQPQY